MAITVFPLDLGEIELDRSFTVWQMGCGKRDWFPAAGWLVLGAGKPILVDSAFRSVEDAKQIQGLTCRRSEEQELSAQIGKYGITPSDVGLLIHTHVHMDHAGQDHLVPNARILVQRTELQNAAAPDMFPVQFYDRINVARLVNDHWHRVDILDGEQEVVPGVRCTPLPGHTPGHQVVYVATTSGTTVIAGDAAMNVRYNVRQGIPPGFLDDMALTMQGIRRLQREATHVLCSHDQEVFGVYPDGVS
jgi:N-acyl homoserine lactone hydrolase